MSTTLDLPELDLHSEEFISDPQRVLRPLLEVTPLARSRRGIEVLRYNWAYDIINDSRFHTPDVSAFLQKEVPPTFREFVENGFLLSMTGERHDRIRRVMTKAFTIKRVSAQKPVMEQVANGLIDELLTKGSGDVVSDYSFPFAARMICHMIGVPSEDIPEFAHAGRELSLMGAAPISAGYPRIEAALITLRDYVAGLIELRRSAPNDDFISSLIEVQETEGRLTEEEMLWNIVNLMFAGMDTSRYQLASAVRALITEPGDNWDYLAENQNQVPNALLEAMRFYPVAQFDARIPVEDVEYEGFVFPKGQRVFLNTLGASRDPRAFDQPNIFDINRSQQYEIRFGRGLHYCVGNVLARLGMEESLRTMTRRLKNVRVTEDIRLAAPASMVGGPEQLLVTFEAR